MKLKLLLVVGLLFCNFAIRAGVFQDKLDDLDTAYYKITLTQTEREQVLTLARELADMFAQASLVEWKLFKATVRDAALGYKFENTESEDAIKALRTQVDGVDESTVGQEGATGAAADYEPLADRINSVIAQASRSLDSDKVTSLTNDLTSYLLELPGSPEAVTRYLMAARAVRGQANASQASDLRSLESSARSITFQNKIAFLERVSGGAFGSSEERQLFMDLALSLINSTGKLSYEQLINFYSALVQASESDNFEQERNQLGILMDSVLDAMDAQLDAGGGEDAAPDAPSVVLSGFGADVARLEALVGEIDELFASDATAALGLKNEFSNLLNELENNLGDALISEHFAGTVLSFEAQVTTENEVAKVVEIIDSTDYKRSFDSLRASLSTKKQQFVGGNLPSNEAMLVRLERITTSDIPEDEKPRYLRQLDLMVRRAHSAEYGPGLDDGQKSRLETVLNVAKNNDFRTDARLDTLMAQDASTLASARPEGVVDASTVFSDGDTLAWRQGDSGSAGAKFLRFYLADDGTYLLRGSSGGLIDTKAQFRVIIDDDGSFGLYSDQVGRMLEYTTDLAGNNQDLRLSSSSPSITNDAQKFYLVSIEESDDYGIMSAQSQGYLTTLSDNSVAVTDFANNTPLAMSSASSFRPIVVNQFYQSLSLARNQADALRINMYSNSVATVTSEQQARSLVREVGLFLLSKRLGRSAWNSLVDNDSLTSSLSALLDSFAPTGSLAAFFQDVSPFVQALREVLAFSDDKSLSLAPAGERYFWLVEPEFDFSANLPSLSVGVEGGAGQLQVGFAAYASSDPHVVPAYTVILGANNNAQIHILKNGVLQKSEKYVMPSVATVYQVGIDTQGKISVMTTGDNAQELASWADAGFASMPLVVGLAAMHDMVEVSEVSVVASAAGASMAKDIVSESYTAWVNRLLNSARRLKPEDISVFDELVAAAQPVARIQASPQDLENLEQAITFAQNDWDFRNNTTATGKVAQARANLGLAITNVMRTQFLWNTYESIQAYANTDYDRSNMSRLVDLVVNNVRILVPLAYDANVKRELEEFIGFPLYDVLFASHKSYLQEALGSLEDAFQVTADATASIQARVSVHESVLPRLKTLQQRVTFLADVRTTVNMLSAAAPNAGSPGAVPGQVELQEFLNRLKINAKFADLAGSVELLSHLAEGNQLFEPALAASLQDVRSGNKTATDFMTELETEVELYVAMISAGMIEADLQLKPSLITYLTDLRENYSEFGAHVNKLDFMINTVRIGGQFEELVDELRTEVNTVSSVAKRNVFLSKIDTNLVSYIENAAHSGSLTTKDEKLATDLIDYIMGAGVWFKDADTQSRLAEFKNRIKMRAGVALQVNQLEVSFNNLGQSEAEVNVFLDSLKSLSERVKADTAAGKISVQSVDTFNDFIDEVVERISGPEAEFGYGILFLKHTYEGEDLNQLKVEARHIINLNAQITALITKVATTSSAGAASSNFKPDFEALMLEWRRQTLLHPEAFVNNDKFKELFTKARANYFIRNALDVQTQQLSEAEAEIFGLLPADPEENIGLLQTMLQESPLPADSAAMLASLENLVSEWSTFRAITFDQELSKTSLIALLDAFLAKSEFANDTTKLNELKAQVNASLTMNDKVAALNNELQEIVDAEHELSDLQKDNVVDIITEASQAVSSSGANDVTRDNKTALKGYVQSLIDSNDFTDPQEAEMTTALNRINAVVAASQPSTPQVVRSTGRTIIRGTAPAPNTSPNPTTTSTTPATQPSIASGFRSGRILY